MDKPSGNRERRLKIRELQVLMAVIQSGGMGKAARSLHTSQPAVSRAITELEQVLGVRLFDRLARGIEPTAFGRALYDCGVAVFDELRRGIRNIEHLADPTAGEIRIGCNPFLAASFVPAVIARLHRRHPRVVVQVVVGPSASLQRELHERNVDLLVTRSLGNAFEDEGRFEGLFGDSFVVVAAASHALARRRRVTLAELADEPWVLPPEESTIGAVARDSFRGCGLVPPRATVVAVPMETKLALLHSGRFLTIFPSSALRLPRARPELRVLPVELAARPVTNGILTARDRSLSPLALTFIQAAREVARAIR